MGGRRAANKSRSQLSAVVLERPRLAAALAVDTLGLERRVREAAEPSPRSDRPRRGRRVSVRRLRSRRQVRRGSPRSRPGS